MKHALAPDDVRAKNYDVFVSYKREDDDARAVLVAALEAGGYEVFWDGKLNNDLWKIELRDEINRSKMVICLWSAKAAASENVKAEAYHAFGLKKLLSAPIEDKSVVPKYVADGNLHPFDGWADEGRRGVQMAKILCTLQRATGGPSQGTKRPDTRAAISVEFGDIPGAPARLIGRDTELAMLRAAWESKAPKKTNAVVLSALGGAGKSALLRTFANELLAAGGGGAQRIYGWSAYSQGSGEQQRADADGFISKALGDLGFVGELPKDPVERARALAKLIQRERTLLLLDGLEPLQDPPGVNKGRFKDKGLAELTKILANSNPGLVVLTTRQEVPELGGHGALVVNHALDQLSSQAGTELLVELGVRGRQRDLEAAVESVEGHALSVTLLGTFLSEVHGGDIRHRDQFNFADIVLTKAEQEALATDKTIIPAKRADKVMRGYLEQFDKLAKGDAAAGLGGPERAILQLLGLFDRPADGKAVTALLTKRIPGLTDELFVETILTTTGRWFWKSTKVEVRELTVGQRCARLREAKSRLRKLKLLSGANPSDPLELDAHPIVRAFFSGRLAETAPEAAKAAHEILYRHYAAAAPDLPDTLKEMQPLFHAVQHGVKAGRAHEALDEVFWRRMQRNDVLYIARMLGAFGTRLSVSSYFFQQPWREPLQELPLSTQPVLLNSVASALTAVGRPIDSVEPRLSSLRIAVHNRDWLRALYAGWQLTNTLLLLGKCDDALTAAEHAIAHAELSCDQTLFRLSLLNRAAALSIVGDRDGTASLLAMSEAVTVDDSKQNELQYLSLRNCSLQIYRLGEHILSLGDTSGALNRGRSQLDLISAHFGKGLGLHNVGFAHLLIGRAQDAIDDKGAPASLDAAVEGLRKAHTMQHLPLALLVRAANRRRRVVAGERDLIEVIRADLDEVADIAGDEMRLHLTDLALERARLALDVPQAFASPAEALAAAIVETATAATLITNTGYHRRDGELADLQARLASK